MTDTNGSEMAGIANEDAEYPNIYWNSINDVTSDFWQMSSFRMSLTNMTIGYSIPKSMVNSIGIDGLPVHPDGDEPARFLQSPAWKIHGHQQQLWCIP
ncbi:MAG: hypothetical protein MZV63_58130 [Marinilabiliales bacterium]|nr:hypothetical protein [Marinilabiliales bacterium]